MARKIKISQCMILKNEESNIRQALSWGKGVVWEQIVVDTGSTDKTVEIAREMGAKVFHFEWCDDFAVAKNYAIEQASGDWIVFLDADEYFEPTCAQKLSDIILQAQEQLPRGTNLDMIRATLQNLDNNGKTFMVGKQDRIFRNCEKIRYRNPIHEELYSTDGKNLIYWDATKSLSIMHTGYRNAVIQKKGERNLPLLQNWVEREPNNDVAWCYLAESLAGAGRITQARLAVERVLNRNAKWLTKERQGEIYALWLTLAGDEEDDTRLALTEKAYQYYAQFCQADIINPDVEFAMGSYLAKIEKEEDAVRLFEQAFQTMERWKGGSSLRLSGGIQRACNYLAAHYLKIGQIQQAVSYLTLTLRLDNSQEEALALLLGLFKEDVNTTAEQVYTFLNGFYHFDDNAAGLKGRLLVLKAAITKDYQELVALLQQGIPENELTWLHTDEVKPWMLSTEELRKRHPNIPIKNRTDVNFLRLMEELDCRTTQELSEAWENAAEAIKMFKKHKEDFLFLYKKFEDYRSKQTFYGILEMWLRREERFLELEKEAGVPYWDLDLIPTVENACCVNVGTWIEPSTEGFLYCYGDLYKKLYCFSEKETKDFSGYRDVLVSMKNLSTLKLDEELMEPLGVIRLDVGEKVRPLLENSMGHIQKEHSALVLSVEKHLNALYEIPRLLLEWNPDYRLYLRYYGRENAKQLVLFAI